tara:strand:+ start:117 stop:293 length:177 start_codon:yes stop_codon:yes gene_type:complete
MIGKYFHVIELVLIEGILVVRAQDRTIICPVDEVLTDRLANPTNRVILRRALPIGIPK